MSLFIPRFLIELLMLSLRFFVAFVVALSVFADMPAPFYRELYLADPVLTGNDITILQTLLNREKAVGGVLTVNGKFDVETEAASKAFQDANSLKSTGVIDSSSASLLLTLYEADGYKDSGFTAASMGYLYKFHIPVHTNRSIETYATLYDKDNNKLLTFRARTHGYRDDDTSPVWPDFGTGDVGVNQFVDDGNTVTGLIEMDLNTPEPNPTVYGPWPVNRFVRGLDGNAAVCKLLTFLFCFFLSNACGSAPKHSRWTAHSYRQLEYRVRSLESYYGHAQLCRLSSRPSFRCGEDL